MSDDATLALHEGAHGADAATDFAAPEGACLPGCTSAVPFRHVPFVRRSPSRGVRRAPHLWSVTVVFMASSANCAVVSGLDELEKIECVDEYNASALAVPPPADASDAGGWVPIGDRIDAGRTPDASEAGGGEPVDAAARDGAPGGGGGCGGTAGPAMVPLNGFCIDATEVTNEQYAAFLLSKGADVSGQPPVCLFNTSYVPSSWPPPGSRAAFPVTGVDWCDAFAYCAWAGKRLCGSPSGGATPYNAISDPAVSAWFAACSNYGGQAYPYANSYDGAACNGEEFPGNPASVRAVATTTTCRGGASPDIFDLSGNVWEWEDACDGATGTNDRCRIRGGGMRSLVNLMMCGGDNSLSRGNRSFDDVGFRCCSK